MRFLFGGLMAAGFLIGGLPAHEGEGLSAGRPPLLEAAFQGFLESQQRWAYTETVSFPQVNGSPAPESVFRIDPSLPYAQQRVPMLLSGQPPKEKQLREWAQHSEQRGQQRMKAIAALTEADRDQGFRLRVLNREVRLVLGAARIIAEDATSTTYEIPLQESGPPDAPRVDDYQLTARVNKARRKFEHATIRQTKLIRIAGGKYFDGVTEIDFTIPDPQYPSVPTRLSATSTNKPLFGPAHPTARRVERTDFKRVSRYDERFKVKLAPLNLLDF